MKVLADIGNSQIKISISENDKIFKVKTFALDDKNIIRKYLLSICKNKACNLFYSSVLGSEFQREFGIMTKNIFRNTRRFKSTRSLMSVKNAYPNPGKLGSDRWAQIVYANKFYGENALIVSCGSAISIDYVESSGIHKGGILLSGAERYTKCFDNIHNMRSIKLSKNMKMSSNILQKNTTKQITMGYRLMISSVIYEIYKKVNSNKGKKDTLLILSGSYAKNISDDIRLKKIIEPFLVLKSLAYLMDSV